MTQGRIGISFGATGLALLLAGCARPPLPKPKPAPAGPSPTAMVEAIRVAAAHDKSVVQVTPLRDPSVTGFLDAARADEGAGKYEPALHELDAALKLSPDAPDILQRRAEIEILLRNYPAADADARRSWALGARVGSLCASNWQTVLEIARTHGDSASIASARKNRNACREIDPLEPQ